VEAKVAELMFSKLQQWKEVRGYYTNEFVLNTSLPF